MKFSACKTCKHCKDCRKCQYIWIRYSAGKNSIARAKTSLRGQGFHSAGKDSIARAKTSLHGQKFHSKFRTLWTSNGQYRTEKCLLHCCSLLRGYDQYMCCTVMIKGGPQPKIPCLREQKKRIPYISKFLFLGQRAIRKGCDYGSVEQRGCTIKDL